MHENPKAVDVAFLALYGDGKALDRVQRLNKRNELAKKLVTTDYKHLAGELGTRAKEAHARDLKEWDIELDGIDEAEDVLQHVPACYFQVFLTNVVLQRARDSFQRCPPSPQTYRKLHRVLRHPPCRRPRLCGHRAIHLYVRWTSATFISMTNQSHHNSVHHFPQDKAMHVNWAEFDKHGFTEGVAGSFLKYIRWMGTLLPLLRSVFTI